MNAMFCGFWIWCTHGYVGCGKPLPADTLHGHNLRSANETFFEAQVLVLMTTVQSLGSISDWSSTVGAGGSVLGAAVLGVALYHSRHEAGVRTNRAAGGNRRRRLRRGTGTGLQVRRTSSGATASTAAADVLSGAGAPAADGQSHPSEQLHVNTAEPAAARGLLRGPPGASPPPAAPKGLQFFARPCRFSGCLRTLSQSLFLSYGL